VWVNIKSIWTTVTKQGVTAQICPVTVHFVWIPEWLIRINPAASLMRVADLIFFRGGVCSDCAWDAWGSSYLAVWDGIAGRWRRDWWNECGAALMSDGGDCGGEEIWNETGLWRKLERGKTGGYARTDNERRRGVGGIARKRRKVREVFGGC
jgi:hypothetical protein